MDVLIRTLLIWLLMLAIPAQGVAAAAMAFCGPKHHGGGSAVTVDRAASPVHAHGDHRIAMSAAVAGQMASAPVAIEECDNVATSFPGFVELATRIGFKVVAGRDV